MPAEFRRAMCKLWFNAKWRDLLLATVSFLSDRNLVLKLPLSREANVEVLTSPYATVMPFRVPVAAESKTATKGDEEGDAIEIDATDRAADPAFMTSFEEDEGDTEDTE
jgi:hypothetical protein